jgi:hypothetical protein
MEPIPVPGPPKSAFNKHRRISDLIKKQVEHFKHLEYKISPEARATLPQHGIVTEDDAARYITAMTRFLAGVKPAREFRKVENLRPPSAQESEPGLALAAEAENVGLPKSAKSRGSKRSPTKRKGKK